MNNIVGLIIAGGYSRRMGDFKPLLPINGETLIENRILSMAKAGIPIIFVVTGHKHKELETLIEKVKAEVSPSIQVITIYNENYDQGMFSSIRAGMKIIDAISENHIKGALLLPVDYPLIDENHYVELHNAWLGNTDQFAVPCYYGKKGHPLIIPKKAWKEILSYKGNKGLKGVTNKYEDGGEMLRVEMNDERVLLDIDTPKDYSRALEWDSEATIENKFLNFKGRLFLIRHGETQLHKEKIFLGQTDVQLSYIGRQQALKVAKELNNWNITDPLLIASDLSRTKETAKIIQDNTVVDHLKIFSKLTITEEVAFRELDLGTWDGQFISKIIDEHSKEYKKRGDNILSYKSGYEGENFYDLQYRVMKKLGKLLKEHPSRDLIIVSHSGVIRIILCNLLGISLENMQDFYVPRASLNILSF